MSITATSTFTRWSTPLMAAVGLRSASTRLMPVGVVCAVAATGASVWTQSTPGNASSAVAVSAVMVAE